MSEQSTAVQVKILDKEYQVNCPPSDQEALIKSARYLDENMRKIKGRGNIHGVEKIAVMAALNITHDMLKKNRLINETRQATDQQVKGLEDKLDMESFFCDPHSPWQRGAVENANGLLRRDLPRKTDLTDYSDQDINDIVWAINTTPRKCLGYLTPAEAFLHQLRCCT